MAPGGPVRLGAVREGIDATRFHLTIAMQTRERFAPIPISSATLGRNFDTSKEVSA